MDERRQQLFDFDHLQARLSGPESAQGGLEALRSQIETLLSAASDDEELRTLGEALELATPVLARDPDQLAGQLLGRLSRPGDAVAALRRSAARSSARLLPRRPTLTSPGSALRRSLEGHDGAVYSVAAVDGGRVISASADRTLRLWDLERGRTEGVFAVEEPASDVLPHALISFDDGLAAVTAGVLPDGEELAGPWVVAGSQDGFVRIWTGQPTAAGAAPTAVLTGHVGPVHGLATIDDRRVISAAEDGTLRLWNVLRQREIRSFEGHTGPVIAVTAVDRQRVLSASADATLRLWSLEDGKVLRTFAGHEGRVRGVALLGDRMALSSAEDGILRVWNLESGEVLQTLSISDDGTLRRLEGGETPAGRGAGVSALAVAPGRQAVFALSSGRLLVWDLVSGAQKTLDGHAGTVRSLALLGRHLVSASSDRTLRVWDLERPESPRPARQAGRVTSVAIVGRQAVSGSRDGTVRVWDLESGQAVATLEGHTGAIRALAAVEGGTRAVSASGDRTLRLWDVSTGESLQVLDGHSGSVLAVAALDRRRIVSASSDGRLAVWDLEDGQAQRLFEGHRDWVTAVAVVDPKKRMVSASADRTLRIWDLRKAETLATLETDLQRVSALAVVAGRWILAGAAKGWLQVADVESGLWVRRLAGHGGTITALVAVDERRAVSASTDRTLRLWDVQRGEELAVLTFDAPLGAVAASGGTVVAGDAAGSVHVCVLRDGPPASQS